MWKGTAMKKRKKKSIFRRCFEDFFEITDDNYEHLYIYTHWPLDMTKMLAMVLLDPVVVFLFIFWFTGIQMNLILVFIVVDAWVLDRWKIAAMQRKADLIRLRTTDWPKVLREKVEELEGLEFPYRKKSRLQLWLEKRREKDDD